MRISILALLTISLFTSVALCDDTTDHLGIFDASYNRAVWKYKKSSEGVDIFEHRRIRNCIIYSATITETFEEDAKKTENTFYGKTYYVTKGFKNNKLRSLYYCSKKSPLECLRVYVADVNNVDACIQASEQIIIEYEKKVK